MRSFFLPGFYTGLFCPFFSTEHLRWGFPPDISCPGYTVRLSFKKVRLISPSRAGPEPEYVRVNVVAWGAAKRKVADPQALDPLAVVAK